jgi:hypothetical protein
MPKEGLKFHSSGVVPTNYLKILEPCPGLLPIQHFPDDAGSGKIEGLLGEFSKGRLSEYHHVI